MSARYGSMSRITPLPVREVPRQNNREVAPTTPTATPFGAELRRLRGKVSQSRLADAIGVNHSYIARLESSNRHPSRNVVLGIIAALELDKTDAARLLNLAGYTAGTPSHPIADELAQALADEALPLAIRTDLGALVALTVRQAYRAAEQLKLDGTS